MTSSATTLRMETSASEAAAEARVAMASEIQFYREARTKVPRAPRAARIQT